MAVDRVVSPSPLSPTEAILRQAINHLDAEVAKQSPWASYEFVDVTFPAGANTDLDIRHSLVTDDPEKIRYQVVASDRAVRVYTNQAVGRLAWTSSVIYLRADVASAVCRLLLTVER